MNVKALHFWSPSSSKCQADLDEEHHPHRARKLDEVDNDCEGGDGDAEVQLPPRDGRPLPPGLERPGRQYEQPAGRHLAGQPSTVSPSTCFKSIVYTPFMLIFCCKRLVAGRAEPISAICSPFLILTNFV
eukprot:scaffold54745_cov20-Prasinocladus_malaysianus.AAC.1